MKLSEFSLGTGNVFLAILQSASEEKIMILVFTAFFSHFNHVGWISIKFGSDIYATL